ncbi:acetyltransferase [Leptotrichia sp. OH3620_COT-345]|uniref:acyltransferase family protein n=1 Tax=Leptotrichia sp. OH3620_COT-345 TaxID=2491048 RepID=UPI000F65095B|nr:acyltransferase family protein [Leptotrichia sp. OH3620_COT-345]RRD40679.1 acetyltransferase [Leptotrichia sp. OH3620_COT-345]
MEKKKRIAGIDILRAVGLIMICLYHWFPYKGTYIGVVIFFVMSGYLFTESLISKEFLCSDVIKKRMGKIYPSLLAVITVSTVLIFFMNGGLEQKYRNSVFFSVTGLNNIYQGISGISYFDTYNTILPLTHIWALSFQIQMYVLLPFLLKGLKKLKLKNLGIVFFIISILSAFYMAYKYYKGVEISSIYYGTGTRAFSFFIGAGMAAVYQKKGIKTESEKIKILLFGIAGFIFLILFSLTVDYKNSLNYYGLLYLMSIFTAFTVILCSKLKLKKLKIPLSGFVGKILLVLGRHEYQYYLWQYPIMIFTREFFKWSKISFLYQFILQIFLLVIISEISYYIFEKRKIRNLGYIMAGIIVLFLFFSPEYINKDLEEMKLIQSEIKKEEKIETGEKSVSESKISEKSEKNNKGEIQNLKNVDERKILFIGDSVLEMAKPVLEKKYPNSVISVKVGRQFSELPGLLNEFKSKGELDRIVVIALGTNGSFSKEDISKVMEILYDKEIYLVNSVVARPWEKSVNKIIGNAGRTYKNIKVIDWYSYAKGKRNYFYKDGVHPKPEAVKKYVELVYKKVSEEKK